jgi:hypothetical protein
MTAIIKVNVSMENALVMKDTLVLSGKRARKNVRITVIQMGNA